MDTQQTENDPTPSAQPEEATPTTEETATQESAPREQFSPDGQQNEKRQVEQRLTPQQVRFSNKNSAKLVAPPSDAPSSQIISALGLKQPGGLLLMVGSANQLEESVKLQLIQLFSRGLARAAADADATIIDNGRNSGITAITGRGVADRGHQSPLVGVVPAGKVTFSDDAADDAIPGDDTLEPNHSHFVLVEGDEWGNETETMFQLVSALAEGKQVVTVLVNGDELAKKQILQSVRKDWSILVIRGSGGLADEIAELWQKRPPFIPDPDLAEITVDGKLHFFQLGGPISEFERRLEQLLHFKEAESISTIELAWQRFGEYDQNANRQQGSFTRMQGSILILGVLGTLLALVEFTFKTNFDVETVFTYFIAERTMYYVLLAIPISITLLAAVSNRFSPGNKWILLRASAESIKKEIYRYRTRTEIYSDRKTKKTSREMKLERKIEALSRKLMQTEVNVSAIKPYDGPIPPKYGAAPGDDGLSFLTPERYMTYRLQDQLDYYRNKTVRLENRLKRMQWIIYLAGAVGTALVAIGLELWIALTTSVVTALTTYLEYQQVENTLMRYNQTATDLVNVKSWWISLSAEEQADPRNIDKLVAQTETSIHSEHAAWVQEMQDAMAELRAEQTGEEYGEGEEGSTAPQAGTLLITNINR